MVKPAVRNSRVGHGNVGIIRSLVRAIALPNVYRFYSSLSTVWTSFKPSPFVVSHRLTVGVAQCESPSRFRR
jgi:hypothetical protein